MVNSFAVALIALVPLIAGTTPHDPSENAITVALCNGGAITSDLGEDDGEPARDCHQKGCHAGACREKHKPKPNRLT